MEERVPYHWEWDGRPVYKKDGRSFYRGCRQVFDGEDPRPTVTFLAGDTIFCNVDGDPRPWVAQCIEFCYDPSILKALEDAADETEEISDDEVVARDVPLWMPMRVSLRWMYRLSDVREDKGTDVEGHDSEVFISDHVTGPEVNSVNIIDGRATLTTQASQVPSKPPVGNLFEERIYLCTRYYRHGGAKPLPKKSRNSRHYPTVQRTWRNLDEGELLHILKNPSDSPFMFFTEYNGTTDGSTGHGKAPGTAEKRRSSRGRKKVMSSDSDSSSESNRSSKTGAETGAAGKKEEPRSRGGRAGLARSAKRGRTFVIQDEPETASDQDADAEVHVPTPRKRRTYGDAARASSPEDVDVMPDGPGNSDRDRHDAADGSPPMCPAREEETPPEMAPTGCPDGDEEDATNEHGLDQTECDREDAADEVAANANEAVDTEELLITGAAALARSNTRNESIRTRRSSAETLPADQNINLASRLRSRRKENGVSGVSRDKTGVDAEVMDVEIISSARATRSAPGGIITSALESLNEQQKDAFRRNVPWILESMQVRFQKALASSGGSGDGARVGEAQIAEVVKAVVTNFCKFSPVEMAQLSSDSSARRPLL
jgi:ribosomal protein L21E